MVNKFAQICHAQMCPFRKTMYANAAVRRNGSNIEQENMFHLHIEILRASTYPLKFVDLRPQTMWHSMSMAGSVALANNINLNCNTSKEISDSTTSKTAGVDARLMDSWYAATPIPLDLGGVGPETSWHMSMAGLPRLKGPRTPHDDIQIAPSRKQQKWTRC